MTVFDEYTKKAFPKKYNMDCMTYEPDLARHLAERAGVSIIVGVCCAVIYNLIYAVSEGKTGKKVPVKNGSWLHHETSFPKEMCSGALLILFEAGLISSDDNLATVWHTGFDALLEFNRRRTLC